MSLVGGTGFACEFVVQKHCLLFLNAADAKDQNAFWNSRSVLYMASVFVAGTLAPPGAPLDNQPWISSSFWLALHNAGQGYGWVCNLLVACFMVSAVSAAAVHVFISSRFMYHLGVSGHGPKCFSLIWPKRREDRTPGSAVPWVGVLVSLGFAAMAFMCVPPMRGKAETNSEVVRLLLSRFVGIWSSEAHRSSMTR